MMIYDILNYNTNRDPEGALGIAGRLVLRTMISGTRDLSETAIKINKIFMYINVYIKM